MSIISRVVETILDKADRDGTFDHLRGEGKPIEWQDETHVPEEQRLAYRVLRDNDCRLPWMDEAEALDCDLIKLRQQFHQAWLNAADAGERKALKTSWHQAVSEYNRRIFEYNLRVPLPRFQRMHIDAEQDGTSIFTTTAHTTSPQE